MLHARIAARAFNTPLLVEPSKAMAFLSGLGPRILGRRVELADHDLPDTPGTALPPRASILARGLTESLRQHGDAPYPMVDGIAVIEISGVLIHRGGWIGQSSGQTSYEGIAAQIEAAADDPNVRGLALEIDSFGGEVAGVLISQIAFVQFGAANLSGLSSQNTPSRRAMPSRLRLIGSCCPARGPLVASGSL